MYLNICLCLIECPLDSSLLCLCDRVTDLVTTKLLSKCRPYLIHLSMRGCTQLQSSTFLSISECRNLQDLNLSQCKGLDVSTNIQDLNLPQCKGLDVSTNIQDLNLPQCKGLDVSTNIQDLNLPQC